MEAERDEQTDIHNHTVRHIHKTLSREIKKKARKEDRKAGRKLLGDSQTDKYLMDREKEKQITDFPSSPMLATLFCCQQSCQ